MDSVGPDVNDAPPERSILGVGVAHTTYPSATAAILGWSRRGEGRYVCAANVHMIMEAFDDVAFREVVNGADLATPDGMPLVWMLRRLGIPSATRVYGPDLMAGVCEAAARAGVPIGLFGGTDPTLGVLSAKLKERWPDLEIAYAYAPPFRALTEDEDSSVVADILASGARILFVALGCPKQEWWMARHRDRLPLVQIGVGAAFDFHAGTVAQAPSWLQRSGLEWAFRLLQEPRRLWRRYLVHNPRFLLHAALQLSGIRRYG